MGGFTRVDEIRTGLQITKVGFGDQWVDQNILKRWKEIMFNEKKKKLRKYFQELLQVIEGKTITSS